MNCDWLIDRKTDKEETLRDRLIDNKQIMIDWSINYEQKKIDRC